MKKILSIFVIILMVSALVYGAESINSSRTLSKTTIANSDIWINANRMNGVFRNNGTWMYDNVVGDWGLEWPKGSGLSPIFAAGQYVGAMVDGEPRIAGVQHSATEFQAGEVLAPGVAANKNAAEYKWYELRPGGVGDWANWPVDQGAPLDADGNPKLIGDQTAFCVFNDLADHTEYGTKKLSVEIRQLVWAFNRADAMGDMIFVKWQLINKSAYDWEDTYFVIWSDPDLGDAGDDLVGCDTTLGLGYCYNAVDNDQNYGTAPPAAGIDFFQGPIIDEVGSTVTLPDGTVLQDKKMLKMTSFIFYNNDDSPQGNPQSGGDVWNYMRGYWRDGSPIVDDGANGTGAYPTYPKCPFMFTGDPETDQGWMDSNEADRRFMMTTGPFSMPKWEDTNANGMPDFGEPGVQEIVAGVILARGSSNLNSVTTLKEVDNLAQMAYDLDFILAKSPKAPVVTTSELPNEVLLTWDEMSEFNSDGTPYESIDPIVEKAVGDTVIIDNVVTVIDDDSYNFYGYTVFQYSDASGRDPVKVDHWDVTPANAGDAFPYNKQRFIRILTNKNSFVGNVGEPLINGKEYYYGVVAEGYLEYGAPKIFPSAPTIVTVVPQINPGVRYSASYNDTLVVTHDVSDASVTPSDGSTVVWVADPSTTTGLDYTVTFNEDLTWNLSTPSGVVIDSASNQTGNDAYNIVDGLMVKVQGPDPGINITIPGPFGDYPNWGGYNGWNYSGTRYVSWGPNWGGSTWAGSMGNGIDFFGSTLGPADYVDVEFRWAGADVATEPDRWSRGYVYRRDKGYAYEGLGDVPFSVWDTENNRRLNVCFVEMDGMPSLNDPNNLIPANNLWDMGWHEMPGDTGFADVGAREYLFIMASDYDTSGVYNDNNWGPAADVLYAIWPGKRGSHPYLEGQWDMQIFASNVNSVYDVFTFTAPAAAEPVTAYLKEDLKKINVVPNPYYGYHSGEMNIFERWVQFTNLPEKVTIRIFDLAGNQIRKLEKNDPSTTFLRWDLKNEYELPVASSIYVYLVDVPGVGEKVGKLAIFAPNERLDTY